MMKNKISHQAFNIHETSCTSLTVIFFAIKEKTFKLNCLQVLNIKKNNKRPISWATSDSRKHTLILDTVVK